MPPASLPKLKYVKECLAYNPSTGTLTWKARPLHHFSDERTQRCWNSRHSGSETGVPRANGRSFVMIGESRIAAHSLIWFMRTGRWPRVLEHKNGDAADNRWDNLAQAADIKNPRNGTQRPDPVYLRECFSYNAGTGALVWRKRPLHHFKSTRAQAAWNGRFAGTGAGLPNRDGHIRVLVNQGQFTAHRLIWVVRTGKWPKSLDHKNGDPADNRWSNLREATVQQNTWNRRHDGQFPRGVMPTRYGRRFWARACVVKDDGRRSVKHLGTFDTATEAHAAWCAFVRKDRGEFFRAK